jgi:hypothetical protein
MVFLNYFIFRLVVPMPKTYAPDGPVVVLIQSGAYNPSLISSSDCLALALINTDIYLMEDDNYTVSGQILIFDLQKVSMGHIIAATPQEMKRLVYLNQEAVPVRQKALHFINAPPSCMAAYNMVKSLVCDKVKKRVGFSIQKHWYFIFKIQKKKPLPK